MADTDLARVVRQSRRADKFAPDAACTSCGERSPAALVAGRPSVRCYQCTAIAAGRRPVEAHHVAGKANSALTVSIPANDHRVLSDRQQDWPKPTLRNPDGRILIRAAAQLEGWLDVLRLVIERGVVWIPDFMRFIDAALERVIGPDYEEVLGISAAFAGVAP